MSQLLWTCLPNGLRRNDSQDTWQAYFSLFVTPRLSGGAKPDVLAGYPAFVDWPASLRGDGSTPATFEVQLHDGSRVAHSVIRQPDNDSQADSAAWRAIFSESTRVTPFAPPPVKARQAQAVQSYPASELLDTIRSVYSGALAKELGVKGASSSLAAFNLPASQLSARAPINENAVEAFARFYQGSGNEPENPGRKNADEQADFHQIVAALGSYPLLLRKLGLILDFKVDLGELPVDKMGPGAKIRVLPDASHLADVEHQSFWTAISVGAEGSSSYRLFSAASASTDRSTSEGAFGLASTSIALEKVEHAAFALIQQARSDSDNTPGKLPALLQGGMRLGSAGVPGKVRAAMQEQSRLEETLQARSARRRAVNDTAEDDEPLYADQLQRGIRVDVRNVASGQWRSLCARSSRFSAGEWQWPEAESTLADEGCIEPTVFRDDNDRVFSAKVTEDIFEWDGWSLVVPRTDNSSAKVQQLQQSQAAASGTPLNVSTQVAPGSLQPQRFGQRYQFRLRSVDLAGNSISGEQASALEAQKIDGVLTTTPSCYLRVESAKPPVVFRAQPRGLGEAGDMIVLRDAENPRYRSTEFSVHVLPPEVPLRIAEKHGIFDGLDPKQAWQLIQSHRGKLELDDAGEPREAFIEKELYSPYLPDPMVRQAVVKIPGLAGAVDLPPFDAIPKKLRGKELARSALIKFKASKTTLATRLSGRELLVDVPPGRVQKVSLVAKLDEAQLAQSALAHPDWQCKQSGLRDAMPALRVAAATGEAALLAPEKIVQVVHATQRPLMAPVIDGTVLKPREADSVKAELDLQALRIDRPSSGRVDVYARWEDPVDYKESPGFARQAGQLHVGGVHVPTDDAAWLGAEEQSGAMSPFAHDFGDTRYHRVSYRAVAQSRFIEFYPESLTADPDNMTRSSGWLNLHVPATTAPDAPDVQYVLPLLHQREDINQELNLQKDRVGEYGGAGLRIYMNRGWFSSGAGEKLALLLANSKTDASLDAIVSDWGSNPLHDSAALSGRMGLNHITGGVQRINSVPFQGSELSVVLFEVRFSKERGLPFVDIPFLGQKAFMPLLRLGLARYQEHAIENCHFSAPVQTDFVPLTPERSMTVRKLSHDRWRLGVRGYGYDDGHQHLDGSLMQVRLEVLPRSAAPDSVAWRPIGETQNILSKPQARWQHQWDGEIEVTDAQYLSPAWRRRLVVRELEIINGDVSPEALDRARVVSAQTVRI